MKISIAMTTNNGAEFLQAQLDSFVAQTRQPDDLVVRDGGSSDGTLEILQQFQKNAPFSVRIYRNAGKLSHVQNFAKAIERCEGDLIFLSGQDDVWRADKIRKIADTFATQAGVAYVFSDADLVDGNLLRIGTLWQKIGFAGERYQRYAAGDQVTAMLGGGNFVYGNSLAFRANLRDVILPMNNISVTLAHDTWISLLLSTLGQRGVALPDTLVAYRQHLHQVAGAGKKRTLDEGIMRVKEDKARYCREKAAGLRAIRVRARGASADTLYLIEQCITHLQARSALHSMPMANKFRMVWQETASGRYTRFSSSLKSALKDLMLT